jgi:ABC-type glycerol-3-phosphate transport system substrate-binding protein
VKQLTVALVLVALAGVAAGGCAASSQDAEADSGDAILARAFADRATDLQVEGSGTVARILADDMDGDRHQRFVVRLASGQTLLVAHNIDLAPRVEDLRRGDTVAFRGVYEWNLEGGAIHWTHIDPDAKHAAGWLRHGGRTYR